MIEKIKLFEGSKEIEFDITDFNLNIKQECYKDSVVFRKECEFFECVVHIEGKPLDDWVYKCMEFKSPPRLLTIKIYEKDGKDNESIITIDNLYISQIVHQNWFDNDTLEFKLIRRRE